MSHAPANFDILNVPPMPVEEPGRLAEMGHAVMSFIGETRLGRSLVATVAAGALALELSGCGGGGAIGSGDYDGIVLSNSGQTANLANCTRTSGKFWKYDASSLRAAGPAKVESDSKNQAQCHQTLTGQQVADCKAPTTNFVAGLRRGDIVEETARSKYVDHKYVRVCTWKKS